MVIMSIVLIIEPGLNFFLFGIVYVSHGPISWYWRRRTGGMLEEMAAADGRAPDSQPTRVDPRGDVDAVAAAADADEGGSHEPGR
jgi:hypothetical protein